MNTKFFPVRIFFLLIILTLGQSSFATRYSVDVKDFEFSPSNIPAVKIGDTIHWEWKNGNYITTFVTIFAGASFWD